MAVHLPNELIRYIVDVFMRTHCPAPYCSKKCIAPLAMVNHQWLAICEPIIWHCLRINDNELERFSAALDRPSRRNLLKTLFIHISVCTAPSALDRDDAYDGCRDDEEYDGDEWLRWDDGNIAQDHEDLEERAFLLHRETQDFFRKIQALWQELAGWGEDLCLQTIIIYPTWKPTYSYTELLGRGFRAESAVKQYLPAELWLATLPVLPELPSVLSFEVEDDYGGWIWLAIVSFKIAKTFPNLQEIIGGAIDFDKTWYYARKMFREILAEELATLPSSLRNIEFDMKFRGNDNHNAPVPSFLSKNVDLLSRAINRLSINLSNLTLNLGHISSELFWNSEIAFCTTQSSQHCNWPNLETLYIATGFETSNEGYWMRPSDTNLRHYGFEDHGGGEQYPFLPRSNGWGWFEQERLEHIFGDQPIYVSRDRPDPPKFNKLSISIAQAVSRMPKIRSLTLEFRSRARREDHEVEKGYTGWSFAFRADSESRKRFYWVKSHEYIGIDWQELKGPRSEWVFQCPHVQVQWKEPDEAKMLWKEKFPGIELDMVTMEYDDDRKHYWDRWRNGQYKGPVEEDEVSHGSATRPWD